MIRRTALSASCDQCTKYIMPAVASVVAASVTFDARDMLATLIVSTPRLWNYDPDIYLLIAFNSDVARLCNRTCTILMSEI